MAQMFLAYKIFDTFPAVLKNFIFLTIDPKFMGGIKNVKNVRVEKNGKGGKIE